MYICNCRREFKSQRALSSHGRFCKKYIKKPKQKSKSKYKINENLYQCECKREFNNHQSLNAHFTHCLIHRNGKPPIDRFKGLRGWAKGLTKETDKRIANIANTHKENLKTGKTIHNWTGKKHSKETKEKMSKANSGRNNGFVKTKYYEVFCPLKNKNIKVQGTWELKYANYLNENNIEWDKSRKIKNYLIMIIGTLIIQIFFYQKLMNLSK